MTNDDAAFNQQRNAEDLARNPREGLTIELKGWIDPTTSHGASLIIRALFALRNQDGGCLLIGFENDALQPTSENMLADVRSTFSPDRIQGLVSKYASENFNVDTLYVEHLERIHPVIFVPNGVRHPVACKSELREQQNGKVFLRQDEIFVRTASTNGTVSSARLPWKEIPALFERCFANRETNIIPFLTKLLRGLDSQSLQNLSATFHAAVAEKGGQSPGKSSVVEELLLGDKSASDSLSFIPATQHSFDPAKAAQNLLQSGSERFAHILIERKIEAVDFGTWQVALVIAGEIPKQERGRNFLKKLSIANPNFTGWPIWLDSSESPDPEDQPYTHGKHWECFLRILPEESLTSFGHLDFMILDPDGKFYLQRAYQDDLSENNPRPRKVIDPFLHLYRVAESIWVGRAFALAMGCSPDSTKLFFAFKWNELKGRTLQSWANPRLGRFPSRVASQDTAESTTALSLDGGPPELAIATHVALEPLLFQFGGHEFPIETVRHWVDKMLARKM